MLVVAVTLCNWYVCIGLCIVLNFDLLGLNEL